MKKGVWVAKGDGPTFGASPQQPVADNNKKRGWKATGIGTLFRPQNEPERKEEPAVQKPAAPAPAPPPPPTPKPRSTEGMVWAEAMRAATRKDLAGNQRELDKLFAWCRTARGGTALVRGPPGTGKSSAAHAALMSAGHRPVVLHAALDVIDGPALNEIANKGIGRGGRPVLLLDDVDALVGVRHDQGSILHEKQEGSWNALAAFVKSDALCICTLSSVASPAARKLRSLATIDVVLGSLFFNDMQWLVRSACIRMQAHLRPDVVDAIVRLANGNANYALSLAQAGGTNAGVTESATVFFGLEALFYTTTMPPRSPLNDSARFVVLCIHENYLRMLRDSETEDVVADVVSMVDTLQQSSETAFETMALLVSIFRNQQGLHTVMPSSRKHQPRYPPAEMPRAAKERAQSRRPWKHTDHIWWLDKERKRMFEP